MYALKQGRSTLQSRLSWNSWMRKNKKMMIQTVVFLYPSTRSFHPCPQFFFSILWLRVYVCELVEYSHARIDGPSGWGVEPTQTPAVWRDDDEEKRSKRQMTDSLCVYSTWRVGWNNSRSPSSTRLQDISKRNRVDRPVPYQGRQCEQNASHFPIHFIVKLGSQHISLYNKRLKKW